MKPSKIEKVMDLAREARKMNKNFNPLFIGPPGVGKSEIVQAWCKKNHIPFFDLRLAFLEAPDMIGYPSVKTTANGRQVTTHNIPEFWPEDGESVIFLDEVNRGTQSVMNTCMQLLTDRKIHTYTLPQKTMIVACINPENEENDVNSMDTPLKDRFVPYDIEFDQEDFVRFLKSVKADISVIAFVESKTWTYVKPEDIAKGDATKYVSPRTIIMLNTAIQAGVDKMPDIEKTTYEAILGRAIGMAFYQFKNNEQPVSFNDLNDPNKQAAALRKLKVFSDPNKYKSGHISLTIADIVDHEKDVTDEFLAKVVLNMSVDQGPVLMRELEKSRGETPATISERLVKTFPEVKKHFKNHLRGQ